VGEKRKREETNYAGRETNDDEEEEADEDEESGCKLAGSSTTHPWIK
jgi:hypothetical protein